MPRSPRTSIMRKLNASLFDVTPSVEGKCFTPSLLQFNDKLIMSYRIQGGDYDKSEIGLSIVSPDFRLKDFWKPKVQDYLVEGIGALGIEDCRLVRIGDRLGAIATTGTLPDFGPTIIMLSSDLLHVNAARRVGRWSKNWSPIIEDDDLRLMYAPWGPVLEFKETELKALPPTFEVNETMLRGGSQVITYGSGYLTVTHELKRDGVGPRYTHRFVRYYSDLSVRCVSEPFFLESEEELHLRYEYVAGLTKRESDARYVLSYALGYDTCKLAVVTPSEVESFVGLRT